MIALITVETVAILVLSVLVSGLLRGYASVLARLHQLDGGAVPNFPPPFATVSAVPGPSVQRVEGRDEWAPAHDIRGVSLHGEIISARIVGVEHDTVIAFLSSSCQGCAGFWEELAGPAGWWMEPDSRLLIVSKGVDAESPAALSRLCPAGFDLVMSSEAWADFAVPGSPYVVIADGRTGRIKGEGSGSSFSQLGALVQQSTEDLAHATIAGSSVKKPAADREREEDVDRVLLDAGIGPGHPSLYVSDGDGDATGPQGLRT